MAILSFGAPKATMLSNNAGLSTELIRIKVLPKFPDILCNVTQQLDADWAHNLLKIKGFKIKKDTVSGITL